MTYVHVFLNKILLKKTSQEQLQEFPKLTPGLDLLTRTKKSLLSNNSLSYSTHNLSALGKIDQITWKYVC